MAAPSPRRRRPTPPFSAHTLLSSLPLRSPSCPSPSLSPSLLSAPIWPSTLSLSSTLGAASVDHHFSHTVDPAWEGHTGCVNALDWSEDGTKLCSGSDDTKICIFSATPSSSQPFRLETSLSTGHSANIFSVKFAPSSLPNKIWSCAGDSQVRIFDLECSTHSENEGTWMHHPLDSGACVRVLKCHTDRVKRIATEWSPEVFLTCSEDGTVRQHDLRTTHVCRATRRSPEGNCGPPLVFYPQMSLYSLTISKARPHMFVVAGTSPFAYLHDRRMLRRAMREEWGMEMREGEMTQCVRRFGVVDPSDETKTITNQIVAAKLSDSNPRDLLLSYSSSAVYLFDTDAPPHVLPTRASRAEEGERTKRRRAERAHDDEEEEEQGRRGGTPPEQVERDEVREAIQEDISQTPSSPPPFTFYPTREPLTFSPSESDSDSGYSASAGRSPPPTAPEIPLVTPRQGFTGHANSETVKDVNWAFGDRCVVSGSDDGNWFCWDKEGTLRGIWKGDDGVVNVIQPHPRAPILAVSGIDPNIKLFSPTSDSRLQSNLIAQSQSISERNKRRRRPGGIGVSRSALLALLARSLPDDVRDGGGTVQWDPESQTATMVLPDGSVREGECAVM